MNTIKEYYKEIQTLYNSALKMLTALNTSLSSQAATVPLTILDDNSTETIYNIPSFLYLEHKMEQLQDSFSQLMNIPQSGEAWFTSGDSVRKLNLVSANAAPAPLSWNEQTPYVFAGENNIFKDMVFPRLSLRCRVDSLAPDIQSVSYVKVILHSQQLFDTLRANTVADRIDLSTLTAQLYNYEEGTEWSMYESVTQLPLRSRDSRPLFSISEVLSDPYNDTFGTLTEGDTTDPDLIGKVFYDVRFTNIQYVSETDSSRVRTLKPGMRLQASTGYCKVLLQEVPYNIVDDNVFRLVFTAGNLDMRLLDDLTKGQTWSQAYNTYLVEDDDTFLPYTYIDIPLEENPYVVLFVAAVRNNIRSNYNYGTFYNLNNIYMSDEDGNKLIDESGNPYTYIQYYNKFARNAGDILSSLVGAMQPGADTISADSLGTLRTSSKLKLKLNPNNLVVTAINNHLSDDTSLDELKTLHTQKAELTSQLSATRAEIQNISNLIATTDFTQTQDVTRVSLVDSLNQQYASRTLLEKQIIAVVQDINTRANASVIPLSSIKYRLRGCIDVSAWETSIAGVSTFAHLVKLDIQYKYKSISKETVNVTTINDATFTSWNRYPTQYREQIPVWSGGTLQYYTSDPAESDNVIRWNQVDIPIQQGEDVVVRVRGVYNLGQPFVNIYTPWSDEYTFTFPENYTLNADVQEILRVNKADATDASFTARLIEDGYEQHISNSITDNDVTYYHQPENIASGFYTSEQKIIPLRDKLYAISESVDDIKRDVEGIRNLSYEVYVVSQNTEVQAVPNSVTTLSLPAYSEHQEEASTNSFVEETIKIIIKNTGDTILRLYSIFPGEPTQLLYHIQNDITQQRSQHYESCPIWVYDGWQPQRMGQWIYFRSTNPFTDAYDSYFLTQQYVIQALNTLEDVYNGPTIFDTCYGSPSILSSERQMLLRPRVSNSKFIKNENTWGAIELTTQNSVKQLNIKSPLDQYVTAQYETARGVGFWIPVNFAGRYDGNAYNDILTAAVYDTSLTSSQKKLVRIKDKTLQYMYQSAASTATGLVKTVQSSAAKQQTSKTSSVTQKLQIQEVQTITDDEVRNNTLEGIFDISAGWNLGLSCVTGEDLKDKAAADHKSYYGGFLFPETQSINTLQVMSGSESSYYAVQPGSSTTVTVKFQYYLDETEAPEVSKRLFFDIRPSLTEQCEHYILEVKAKYSAFFTGSVTQQQKYTFKSK